MLYNKIKNIFISKVLNSFDFRYDHEDELNEKANDWQFGYYSYIIIPPTSIYMF